ncbi:MAG: 2-C-methyl-D-erythritol 4-phosphate cytidylyltransferase, partial [Alistipes sp.]|nr:2-C-methyl-D-erythritol 4-phosphate cytidylyltransferase [Alistipes sp.]
MARTAIIIVAGGSGLRMGGTLPKQFRMLGAQPVLAATINRFHEALPEAQLIVVLPEAHRAFWENLRARFEVARHTV